MAAPQETGVVPGTTCFNTMPDGNLIVVNRDKIVAVGVGYMPGVATPEDPEPAALEVTLVSVDGIAGGIPVTQDLDVALDLWAGNA